MKILNIFILLVFLSINTSHANADTKNFLEMCKVAIKDPDQINKNPILAGIDIGFCLGYIRGLSDYSTGTASMSSEELEMVKSCRPQNVGNKQLAKIVVKFLENNP